LHVEQVIIKNNGRPGIFFLTAAVEELCKHFSESFGEGLVDLLMECIRFLKATQMKLDINAEMLAAEFAFDAACQVSPTRPEPKLQAEAFQFLTNVFMDMTAAAVCIKSPSLQLLPQG
jgi:hypothetical protein